MKNALMKLKGDYDTTNEDSMISKYEKLSKGVDGFGKNISLTADEYSEYQDSRNSDTRLPLTYRYKPN